MVRTFSPLVVDFIYQDCRYKSIATQIPQDVEMTLSALLGIEPEPMGMRQKLYLCATATDVLDYYIF